MLLASILLIALTRAEIIERMKAPPIIKTEGLVEVVADCPPDMRREFQLPIATFASDVCNQLYGGIGVRRERFKEPGIVVYVGESRTNVAAVVSRRKVRDDGTRFTRIFIPAPAFADLSRFRIELAKAFFLAVKGEEIGDREAEEALVTSTPGYKVNERYERIERWMRGEKVEGGDEELLRLQRSVLSPGVARVSDVLRFASRLWLYPDTYGIPFRGGRHSCSFRDAIALSREDITVRMSALDKSSTVVIFGGGRGPALAEAADAYSLFLRELAVGKSTDDRLRGLLDAADVKLNVAMEEARKREDGTIP